MNASFLQRFPSQVELIREGEDADFLHIVVDGSVEIERHVVSIDNAGEMRALAQPNPLIDDPTG